jgi:hypothetical protein
LRTAPSRSAGLGVELIGADIVLVDKAAVYVRFERTTLFAVNAACYVTATYVLKRPRSLDDALASLTNKLRELGLVTAEAAFTEEDVDAGVPAEFDALTATIAPAWSKAELRAAMVLDGPQTSADLKSLSSSRRVSRGALSTEKQLLDAGLVQVGFTARHKDKTVFATGASREQLASFEGKCKCGKAALDHDISEDLSITDLGTQLITKNRWMTVMATAQLIGAGIRSDHIKVTPPQIPDEIDLAFIFQGDLVLTELKEDEFHPRDALNLVARTTAMPNARALVVTKSAVTPEARRVLTQVFPSFSPTMASLLGSPSQSTSLDRLACLEGPDCLKRELAIYLERERLSSIVRDMHVPGSGEGINIRQVLVEHLLQEDSAPPVPPVAQATVPPAA